MWEYKIETIKFDKLNDLIFKLNEFGSDNWEIISYNEEKINPFHSKANVLFKRLKK